MNDLNKPRHGKDWRCTVGRNYQKSSNHQKVNLNGNLICAGKSCIVNIEINS